MRRGSSEGAEAAWEKNERRGSVGQDGAGRGEIESHGPRVAVTACLP